MESVASKLSLSGQTAKYLRDLFDKPFEVIFVEDGKNISSESTKHI